MSGQSWICDGCGERVRFLIMQKGPTYGSWFCKPCNEKGQDNG